MKKVTYFGLLLAVALTGLSSCSSSDDVTSDPTNTKSGESRLTLTISTPVAKTSSAKGNSFAMGSRATDITDANAPTEANEQQINHITVAIFSSDGQTVRTIQELTKHTGTGSAVAGDGTYSQNDAKASATIVTNSLTAADKIYVVCNAPAGTFQGVQNAAQFKAKTEDIDNSLATEFGGTAGKSLVDHNIPMYGSATLEADGENFKASVDVNHQTAKVTLTSLTVDFDQNGAYKDASFTPTQIFLINVPNDLKFDTDAATGTPTGTAKLWQGYDSSNKDTYKEYLSTSDFSSTATALSGAATAKSGNNFGKTYYFYTMPNNLTDKGVRTKLVIKGTFKANSSDPGSIVYYPVPLNANYANGTATAADDGPAFAVHANKNYKCTVKIKTKGAPNPTDNVTPQQVEIKVTVVPFADAAQNTVFE